MATESGLQKLGVTLITLSGMALLAVGLASGIVEAVALGAVVLGVVVIIAGSDSGDASTSGSGDSSGATGTSPGSGGDGNSGSNGGDGNGGDGNGGGSGGGCFAPGTGVTLGNGRMVPIETIKIGDCVAARHELGGDMEAQPVTEVFTHQVSALLLLQFETGADIRTTKEHRFAVAGRGFVAGRDLAEGSHILRHTGEPAVLRRATSIEENAVVYNLEVDKLHTFFVGANQVWVHNKKDAEDPDG